MWVHRYSKVSVIGGRWHPGYVPLITVKQHGQSAIVRRSAGLGFAGCYDAQHQQCRSGKANAGSLPIPIIFMTAVGLSYPHNPGCFVH